MKPDYFVHKHVREFTDEKGMSHQQVRGEHVMTYRVWTTLQLKDVVNLIGPLAGMTGKGKRR